MTYILKWRTKMDRNRFYIEKIRFHLKKDNILLIRGWYPQNNPQGREVKVYLDEKELAASVSVKSGVTVRQRYLRYQENISEELTIEVELPADWQNKKQLSIVDTRKSAQWLIEKVSVKQLKKKQSGLEYFIETANVTEGVLTLSGWGIGIEDLAVSLKIDGKFAENTKVKKNYRRDVMEVFEEAPEKYEAGFQISAPVSDAKRLEVLLASGEKKCVYKTSVKAAASGKGSASAINAFQKLIIYLRKEGFRATVNRIEVKLFHKKDTFTYDRWLKDNRITKEELEEQKKESFSYNPMFSVVVPLYQTKETYLRALIESLESQTYSNWELCLADGTGEDSPLKRIVEEYQKKGLNIHYEILKENKGISENTNAAIQMATGEYIVLADHDDIITENALYECAKAVNEDKNIDVLYSDEDKIDMSGKKYFDPNFKSDLNMDLLCSMNYICHLFVVKKPIIDKVGMLRSEFDGAQDHDFILRCVEVADKVYHIPKVLYHWRCHMDSTAANPESKLYAFEAGRKAVEEHYKRVGIPAKVEHSSFYGMFRTKYCWQEQPLISIIIPNKDHIEDLKKCMDSIEQKSVYRNFEFVVVENNSTEEETFQYYKELEQRDNVQVVYYKGGFNFSKINNFGATYAKGEYLLLLNNDTEIINPECLEELLGYCMREDVGIVGAKLCYEDDTIQHAGVVIGFGGMAGHAFIEASRYDTGYMGRIMCAQDYSAVTAACMMTKKSVFDAVGGLTEELEVAFNDIDYCLKVRELGKLVVYNPYAELYHYESKSRGLEDTPEKVERFNSEVAKFCERWEDILREGDPYYNPNLTLDKADFSLRI